LSNLSLIDWIILVVLVYSIAISAIHGFVREILGLVSLLAALVLASWFYRAIAPLFKDVVRTENLALFLGFSVIFVGTLVAGIFIIWLINKFMKLAKLQWADRLLGAAFGFIRGWVVVAVLLLGLTAFEVQTERLKSSELAPYFLPGSRVLAVISPYELKAKFLIGYRTLERGWRQ
jgi:membrane protein required for colicin V production